MDYKQRQRLERALSQRMYLISAINADSEENLWNFEVEGNVGIIYNVEFNTHKMSCTCIDYTARKKVCKHIYFIIGRIMNDIELVNQIGEKTNISIFNIRGNLSEKLNLVLNPRLNIHKKEETDEEIAPDGHCTICFEEFKNSQETVNNCGKCHNFFHKECINIWLKRAPNCNCPLCRSPWIDKKNPYDALKKFNSLNF